MEKGKASGLEIYQFRKQVREAFEGMTEGTSIKSSALKNQKILNDIVLKYEKLEDISEEDFIKLIVMADEISNQ